MTQVHNTRVLIGVASAVVTLSAAVAAGGCAAAGGDGRQPTTTPTPTPSVSLAITPKDGSQAVRPQSGIAVRVFHGTLVSVKVRTDGDPVTGTRNVQYTRWHSDWALDVGTRYVVRAVARDAVGDMVTQTCAFRTLTPHESFATEIFQAHGQSYGVGMPVMLTFSRPITQHKAVEQSLSLWASKRVVGAWYWDGDSTLCFRPRAYWPAHTTVRLVAHLNGVEGAPGVYGTHTLRQSFRIGRSLIVVADTQTHRVRVYLDRRRFADWPMSSGKPGDDTPNGTYLTIEKANPVEMKGPGYDLLVPWSVRFTWSGDYLHDASWSVGSQGFANVSHGCVNLSPADAQTYYQLAVPGDPVTITGSPHAGTWDNGWTFWFLSWRALLRGSALHRAVIVGPKGSRLVRPSSLRSWRARPPLDSPQPGNASAS